MRLPVPVCRAAYRTAYTVLRAWWFVRRPEIQGVKCVLRDGERVLLVRHTYGHRDWDLPGGAVKPREPPPQAASREMREELGIVVEHWTAIGQVQGTVDHRRDCMHCFAADIGAQSITIDHCELAAVSWFNSLELPADRGRFVNRILALAEVPAG